MISFIIIGKNEGWKLTKCFESIFKTIEHNKLKEYEVIYVDSKSTDDSIERAKNFDEIKIFKIIGKCNAAIGRNIGAKEASGETLFFIDGDMEIQADFLPLVYSEETDLKYDFVSGQLINFNYDNEDNLILEEKYCENRSKDSHKQTTGGLFFIKRKLWDEVDGMKNIMRRSQDLDLGLRLAKKEVFLLKKKELLAIHHTIPYNDKIRIWKMLFSGANMYRIILLRENITNEYAWKKFIRGNYTFIILILSILLSAYFKTPAPLLIYMISILLRVTKRGERSLRLIFSNLLYIPAYETLFIIGFFFFWPKDVKLNYREVTKYHCG